MTLPQRSRLAGGFHGDTNLPELNYHKETKLLIAYGEPSKLKTIELVLQATRSAERPSTHLENDQISLRFRNCKVK